MPVCVQRGQCSVICLLCHSVNRGIEWSLQAFTETFMAHTFPQCFQVSHMGNIVSSVSFCFQEANYAYATQQGISTKVQACEHSSNFSEHFQIEWDHSILLMNMLHKSFHHINTNEIPSELSRENMISSQKDHRCQGYI